MLIQRYLKLFLFLICSYWSNAQNEFDQYKEAFDKVELYSIENEVDLGILELEAVLQNAEKNGDSKLLIAVYHKIAELYLENKNIEGMILTGGNDLSHLPDAKNSDINRDKTEKEILHWVSKRKIPLLGVCRGMQFMNCFLSGSLSKVKNHSGNSHSIEIFNNKILPIKSLFVNSYHNWAIKRKDLSPSLKAVAIAEDGTIEAVEHHDLPWLGIMWHPERENISQNSNNVKLIKRFFS